MEILLRTVILGTVFMGLMVSLLSCTSPSRRPLPSNNPFQKTPPNPHKLFQQGIATGDVTSHSAQIWIRTQEAAMVKVTWWSQVAQNKMTNSILAEKQSLFVKTEKEHDFTRIIPLNNLQARTAYVYQVEGTRSGPESFPREVVTGSFSTLPEAEEPTAFHFVWSGDLGGQGHCRTKEKGYEIFDTIRAQNPTFAILLGDLMYADNPCPAPPNIAGSNFVAQSLAEFRAKHRYQRGDASLQRLLAHTPIYAVWDDHEVVNNFSGTEEPLMAIGRQAFREYWPIRRFEENPHRMFRKIGYGSALEIFLLDTRQYRSANVKQDGPQKTMLGQEQLGWLLEGLRESFATWKVIVTSVPLGIPKEGRGSNPGNDNWARGKAGTGFHHELKQIVSVILSNRIANVVWLSGDVHFAQANAFDPDRDGVADFHEFVAGPLSAGTRSAPKPQLDLNPTTLFSEGGFTNFGVLRGDQETLTIQFVDENGRIRFDQTISANTF